MNDLIHSASSIFDLENQGATESFIERLREYLQVCLGNLAVEDYPYFQHPSEEVCECVNGLVTTIDESDIEDLLNELSHLRVTHEGYLYYGSTNCHPSTVAMLLNILIQLEPEDITWRMTFSSSTPTMSVDGYSGGIILVTRHTWIADAVDDLFLQIQAMM